MRLLRMISDITGGAKSKMAAIMLEVTTAQLVEKLTRKFQRPHLCFKNDSVVRLNQK
jgi:signal transduction histidine kinase